MRNTHITAAADDVHETAERQDLWPGPSKLATVDAAQSAVAIAAAWLPLQRGVAQSGRGVRPSGSGAQW